MSANLQQRAEDGSEQLRGHVQAAAGPGAVAGQALGEGHRRVQVPAAQPRASATAG